MDRQVDYRGRQSIKTTKRIDMISRIQPFKASLLGFIIGAAIPQASSATTGPKLDEVSQSKTPVHSNSSDFLKISLQKSTQYYLVTTDPENQPKDLRLTREINYTFNKDGLLQNDDGYYLLGLEYDLKGQLSCKSFAIDHLEDHLKVPAINRFMPSQRIKVRASLKADAFEGASFKIVTDIIDEKGAKSWMLLDFSKTSVANQWALTITAEDVCEEGICQGTGVRTGKPYKDVLIDFDCNGVLKRFNGVDVSVRQRFNGEDVSAPLAIINWNDRETKSYITFDFGANDSQDALRVAGTSSVVTENLADGYPLMNFKGFHINDSNDLIGDDDSKDGFKISHIPFLNVKL